jgi:hypothetical protein
MNCELQSDGEHIKVFTPNWLELQENRGGKNRAKTKQKAERGKKREGRGKRRDFDENKIVDFSSPLFNLWNQYRGDLPEAIELNSERKEKSQARWDEVPEQAYWVRIIKGLAESEFCNGGNDRGWRADFDFLLQPRTRIKVLEGKFAGPQKKPHLKAVQVFVP